VFQISFPQFVWKAKCEILCKQLVDKVSNIKYLNTMSVKNILLYCNSVFPLWHFHLCCSCSLYSLVQVLKVERIHNGSGLGQCIVWYMVMNVLEEHSGCSFTCCWRMYTRCPDQNLSTHQSDYSVSEPVRQLWILTFCIFHCKVYYNPINHTYEAIHFTLLIYTLFWSELKI
jgi:hypothetical protein